MCGIAGICGLRDDELLQSMGGVLHHRGPDDHGEVWITGVEGGRGKDYQIGLAHRRLSIIDLSPEGHQPMTVRCVMCGMAGLAQAHESNGLWLTYNGEIYNYKELRADLENKGHSFHSGTDSEVLIHFYAEYGVEMLERLNGIFAFALYDGRTSGQKSPVHRGDLLLARDGLGVKPLYYSETSKGFLFASEIKSLILSPEVSRELDVTSLHYHLAYLWSPAPGTLLKNVKKLLPGEALLIRQGEVCRKWIHYDIPYGREYLAGNEAEIAEELRERLRIAVSRQMVADVPVGAFLSGGLDSSAVVTMMKEFQPHKSPQCYCIGFNNDDMIEDNPADLPFAIRVAKHLGVDLHTIEVQASIIDNLERMLYFLDEPQADPAPLNVMLIAERARQDGIKVLLSGAGGDDIFSGYRRHWALNFEKTWSWLPLAIRNRMGKWATDVRSDSQWKRRAAKMFAHAGQSENDRMVAYFYWSSEQVRQSLYSEMLKETLRDVDTAEPLRNSLKRIPSELSPLNQMLYLEAKHFLADHNLNYTDKMGMAAGVEIRVPFLDLDLIDFATRIPPKLKQHGRVSKYIFKKAMEPYLPNEVIYRPKSGFGAPLRRWLRNELRERVEDVLSEDSLKKRGLFDSVAVHNLIEADQQGKIDAAYTIFGIMCIELWCQMFVDKHQMVSV